MDGSGLALGNTPGKSGLGRPPVDQNKISDFYNFNERHKEEPTGKTGKVPREGGETGQGRPRGLRTELPVSSLHLPPLPGAVQSLLSWKT